MNPLKLEVVSVSHYSPVWEIFIEGAWNRKVHRSIFGKNPRFPSFQTIEEWESVFQEVEYKRVKNYLLWRLSKQNYHSDQLRKILSDRWVTAVNIERLLQEFASLGYLNDQEWLSRQIEMLKKKFSGHSLLLKLRQKGISKEILDEAQNLLESSQDEKQIVQELLNTKYARKDLKDFKQRKKVTDSLMRKGFSYEIIRCMIQERCEWIG